MKIRVLFEGEESWSGSPANSLIPRPPPTPALRCAEGRLFGGEKEIRFRIRQQLDDKVAVDACMAEAISNLQVQLDDKRAGQKRASEDRHCSSTPERKQRSANKQRLLEESWPERAVMLRRFLGTKSGCETACLRCWKCGEKQGHQGHT
eukprot:3757921-Rhodomonas_salina.1